jgi:GTP-binding protein YchF
VERIGLVGLPNSGKSSLFNALTGASTPVAPHPFTTTSTATGVALVPDRRVEVLAELSRSRRVVHAGVEVVDVASLVAGSAGGEGLGNRFLAGLREVDALVYVLRAFEDVTVPGEADPAAALEVIELELVLADLHSVEGQLARRRKAARSDRSDRAAAAEVAALEAALGPLEEGVPLYRAGLPEEVRKALKPAFLLTAKPVLAVVNLSEDRLEDPGTVLEPVEKALGGTQVVLGVSVKLEAEAARLEPAERVELLEGFGLGEGAVARVARAAYALLGRRTFFTTGEKESRAWTFRAGARAPECAGVIHSDLERGFIRAEVVAFEDLVAAGSLSAARAAGRVRLEGKDYEVRDGDVLEIRFNV